jgi:hypothetical protein
MPKRSVILLVFMFRWLREVLILAMVMLTGAVAPAESMDRGGLIRSLRTSDDFRVRTQAALALGGSKSKQAVEPLCQALSDENSTVRAAAAAAIGRLHLGGGDCLERQRKAEKSSAVKGAIKKAIAQLQTQSQPEFTSRSRYYVALGKITDSSGRPSGQVAEIVKRAISDAAESNEAVVLAPEAETTAQAKKRLAAHKTVKGLCLLPRVGAPQYSGSTLKLRIEVAYLTYPGKALLGMMGIPLSANGVSGKDPDIEDRLIVAAIERALEKVQSFGADIP